jgi:poly(A) polymerase
MPASTANRRSLPWPSTACSVTTSVVAANAPSQPCRKTATRPIIVGGAVRDLLAGLTPKDFDVATNATPEQVRHCFRRSRIIGRRFQIVHVNMGAETIEVTTFRGHHGEQGGNKAQTDEQGRVLRDNVFGSQAEDAARRDFTVNALYYDPTSETIVDYHHGVADLQQKTLRMIGDPKTRYREDPVRMLRAVRLAAKLSLSIDPEARRPIREMGSLIENVPPSRLFDEMLKLLTSGHAVRCVTRLREEGLHHGLLPLLDVILDQALGERFVMLALETTDRRVREGRPISPGFLFATLLWHEVLAKWEPLKASGEPAIPALFVAMDEVLDVQAEKLAITRRIAGDIKDIWALQPRFEQRSGKRPTASCSSRVSRPATISCCSVSSPARSSARSASGGRIFCTPATRHAPRCCCRKHPGRRRNVAAVAGQRQTLDRTAASRNESSRLAREFSRPRARRQSPARPDRPIAG